MRKDNVVNVFATDVLGLHQNAEAEKAVNSWGALAGCGEGLSGRSYAIPVYNEEGKVRPISELRRPINTFLQHAKRNPHKTFQVGRLGCGPFGYNDFEIAPYFTTASENVILPSGWRTFYADMRNRT